MGWKKRAKHHSFQNASFFAFAFFMRREIKLPFGAMAQWLEHTIYNREVLGSIPNSPTIMMIRAIWHPQKDLHLRRNV